MHEQGAHRRVRPSQARLIRTALSFACALVWYHTDVDLLCELTTMEVEGYAEANLALLDLSASEAPRKLLASLPQPALHIEV